MSIARFTTLMANRRIFHVRNMAESIPADSDLATQVLSQISSALAQRGRDAAIADIFPLSALPASLQACTKNLTRVRFLVHAWSF